MGDMPDPAHYPPWGKMFCESYKWGYCIIQWAEHHQGGWWRIAEHYEMHRLILQYSKASHIDAPRNWYLA